MQWNIPTIFANQRQQQTCLTHLYSISNQTVESCSPSRNIQSIAQQLIATVEKKSDTSSTKRTDGA